MSIMLFMFFIVFLSFYAFYQRQFLLSIILYGFIPISFLFFFGSFKARLNNTVPLLVLMTYLIYNSFNMQWLDTLFFFYFIPYLSLIIKPKRHPVKYSVVALTTVLLILKFGFDIQVDFIVRVGLVIFIYIVFIPPFIIGFVNKLQQKLSRNNVS